MLLNSEAFANLQNDLPDPYELFEELCGRSALGGENERLQTVLLLMSKVIELESQPKDQELNYIEALDILFEMANIVNQTGPLQEEEKPISNTNCFLLLENCELEKYGRTDKRYHLLLDHLILRSYSSSNQRSHFAILMITTDSQFYC